MSLNYNNDKQNILTLSFWFSWFKSLGDGLKCKGIIIFLNIQYFKCTIQWRHNEHDGVWNHQPHDCLLNRLFKRRSKKTSKLRVTGLCAGNSPLTGEFPAQMASNMENVSIWWRHHEFWPIVVWYFFFKNLHNIHHTVCPWGLVWCDLWAQNPGLFSLIYGRGIHQPMIEDVIRENVTYVTSPLIGWELAQP